MGEEESRFYPKALAPWLLIRSQVSILCCMALQDLQPLVLTDKENTTYKQVAEKSHKNKFSYFLLHRKNESGAVLPLHQKKNYTLSDKMHYSPFAAKHMFWLVLTFHSFCAL